MGKYLYHNFLEHIDLFLKGSLIFISLFFLSIFCSVAQTQTLILQPGPVEGKDALIRTDYPTTNYGTDEDFVANTWTAQGNFFIERSLIQFDLTSIPTNSTVLNAILSLSTNLNSGNYQLDAGANASYLLRVLASWVESLVTWNTQPPFSISNPVILPQSTSDTEHYYVDVTSHVQDMVSNPSTNFGWLFKLQTEALYRCLVFASSDNAMTTWRPKLTVIYCATTGAAGTISGQDSVCQGDVGKVYTVPPITNVINYIWNLPSGASITSGANTDSITVNYSMNAVSGNITVYGSDSCTIGTPSQPFPVTVGHIDSAEVSISASMNNVCAGKLVTFTAIPTNGGASPSYQWKVNGNNVGTNSPSYTYNPVSGDLVSCVLTSSITFCISNNPVTSNTIQMVVNPLNPVSITISPSANPVCSGTIVTYSAMPINGGITPDYQWLVNGVNVGMNNSNYAYIPDNGDIVNCILTSNILCPSGNPAASNTVTMSVNPNLPVSMSISVSANPFCQGSSVTFTAIPTNGGMTPAYQWKINGGLVGPNNPVYSYVPNNGDIVSCELNSSIVCPTGNPATSNSITMVEDTISPVSVSINASVNPVCSGTSVTFTATPANGSMMPSYQWKVNGINTGSNSPVYTYSPANGDIILCVLTSNLLCTSGNPATSNTITMTVNPNLPVSIAINASANPVCTGTQVTFTANPTNPGSTPSYQWTVDGINAGTNNPIYSYIPVNGDIVTCILNSSESCANNNPTSSNQLFMVINSYSVVDVSIIASANPVCSGVPVTFTAIPVNGGSSPIFQWKVNGITAGTNNPIFTYNPVNGDVVACILTSGLPCTTNNPSNSNTIMMNINTLPVVTFTLCNDSITTPNAQPFKLKGGIPLGGTYSGPGVTNGIFYPAISGSGMHQITYTYTNSALCSANAFVTIITIVTAVTNCGQIFTDIRDGKTYPTVQIGSQCWMASNLNYGINISSSQDQRDNCQPEHYCYNDNPANCNGNGGLYQWDELMQYDDIPGLQGLCPPGWHVPTENDWNTLFANYINNAFSASPLKYSGYSGFNALLSGVRHINKSWDFQGFATFFWSSTAHGTNKAWTHGMNDTDPSVSVYPAYRANAFSARCLKD